MSIMTVSLIPKTRLSGGWRMNFWTISQRFKKEIRKIHWGKCVHYFIAHPVVECSRKSRCQAINFMKSVFVLITGANKFSTNSYWEMSIFVQNKPIIRGHSLTFSCRKLTRKVGVSFLPLSPQFQCSFFVTLVSCSLPTCQTKMS